jgi:Na+-driven multidrug efflux pump
MTIFVEIIIFILLFNFAHPLMGHFYNDEVFATCMLLHVYFIL